MGLSTHLEKPRRLGRRVRLRRVELGLYARVFVVNATILALAVSLLAFTPASVNSRTTTTQFLLLGAGVSVMLVANAVLLRISLAPLRRLTDLMKTADLLRPSARLRATGSTEVSAVIGAFNATLARLEEERRSSTRRIVGAQEAERRRIAQELHDEIGQNLTAIILELKRARERVDPEIAEALADAQELARESLDELRRISYHLRPLALDDLGLGSALATLCQGLSTRTGTAIVCDVPSGRVQLAGDAELALYRIAQEALTNALRHADCRQIRVQLRDDAPDDVLLRVADDGIGMQPDAHPSDGIRGMRERAMMVNAQLRIRNQVEGGLEVEAALRGGPRQSAH